MGSAEYDDKLKEIRSNKIIRSNNTTENVMRKQ